MKRTAAIVGMTLGLTAGLAVANPLALQGRDINGNAVNANDAAAVFEYDPNLKMTWLRDWNYAATSGYATTNAGGSGATQINSSGTMGWDAAKTWASNLTVGGFGGWSLPAITDTGSPGCNYSTFGTDCGYNVYRYGPNSSVAATLSPMAYLWYVELQNIAYFSIYGSYPQANYGLKNTGPFTNMQSDSYWSDTEDSQYQFRAWYFGTDRGIQSTANKYPDNAWFAVAVLDCDVADASCQAKHAVPVPATIALLGLGLVGIGAARRKQA